MSGLFAFLSRTFLPHAVFLVVLAAGWWLGELSGRRVALFLGLWLVALAVAAVVPGGAFWMTASVALLDIVLILMVFKGDIRID